MTPISIIRTIPLATLAKAFAATAALWVVAAGFAVIGGGV